MVNKKYRQIFNQSLMINFLIFCEIFVVNFQKKIIALTKNLRTSVQHAQI